MFMNIFGSEEIFATLYKMNYKFKRS